MPPLFVQHSRYAFSFLVSTFNKPHYPTLQHFQYFIIKILVWPVTEGQLMRSLQTNLHPASVIYLPVTHPAQDVHRNVFE